jgi:biopolymer transport protein ExbB/TolQ
MRVSGRRPAIGGVWTVGALLLSAATFAACGESAQDKAKAQVCSSRTTISKEVQKLQGLTLSSSAADEAKKSLGTISDELKKMRDSQSDLAPARKEQVEAATTRFGAELTAIGREVAVSLPSGNVEPAAAAAKPKLKASSERLAADYRQALGPISCA